MALRALFLDVGNTLLTERPSRFELYAQAARARGVDIDEPAMNALMRRAHHELPHEVGGAWRYTDPWFTVYIERIFHDRLGVPRAELPALSEELFGQFSRPETFVLFPGVDALLERARALRLGIGIVSNWSPRLPPLLESLGLAARVDFIVCSAIERLEKPDRAIFQRALEHAGIAPSEALHAGDDVERDLLGAQRAGLRAVLVDHARTHAGWDPARGTRVTSLAELGDVLQRLAH
ncbi:MAG: HAD-IA family hydrolase [Planctomycetes bacterium]|nr:HAD-IA family hydrolase [Planctomycetota bacterium]